MLIDRLTQYEIGSDRRRIRGYNERGLVVVTATVPSDGATTMIGAGEDRVLLFDGEENDAWLASDRTVPLARYR